MVVTKSAIVLATLAIASYVNAEGFSASTTVGFGNSPYKEMESDNQVIPLVQYDSDTVYFRGANLGVHIVNTRQQKFNVFVGYSPMSFNASHSSDPAIRQLDDRYSSAVVGTEYSHLSRKGIVSIKLTHDILSVYGGPSADASYGLMIPLKSVRILPKIGLRWHSSDFNDYYFGVSAKESNRSGLKTYQADSSLTPYISATAIININDHFNIITNVGMEWLPAEVTDSPMVDKETTYGARFSLAYSF